MNKQHLLQETIVLLSADLFEFIYDNVCPHWGDVCDEIILLAERFEKELNWQEDDERDYIFLLEEFENNYRHNVMLNKFEDKYHDEYNNLKSKGK